MKRTPLCMMPFGVIWACQGALGSTQIPSMSVPHSWIDVDNIAGPVDAASLNAAGTNGGSFGGGLGQGIGFGPHATIPGDPPPHSVTYDEHTDRGAGIGAGADFQLYPDLIHPGGEIGPYGPALLYLDGANGMQREFGFAIGNYAGNINIVFTVNGSPVDFAVADFSQSSDPLFFRSDHPFNGVELFSGGSFLTTTFVMTDFFVEVPSPGGVSVILGGAGVAFLRRRRPAS